MKRRRGDKNYQAPFHQAVFRARRQILADALRAHDGNRTYTAAALGIHRTYLCRLIRTHGLQA